MGNREMRNGPSVAAVQHAIDKAWSDSSGYEERRSVLPYASSFIVNKHLDRHTKPSVRQTFVLGDEDGNVEVYAIVDLNGDMRVYNVDDWQVMLLSEDAALANRLSGSSVGDKSMVDGETIVSVDGSPIVAYQEALQIRELRQQKAKQEGEEAAKALASEQERIRAENARLRERQRQEQIQREKELQEVQRLKREMQRERELQEARRLKQEQELQEARRLQQEQIIKQEKAARQKAIDKQAAQAQYDRLIGPLTYEEATTQVGLIKHHMKEGASRHIIREWAANLHGRCMNSRDAVPSASAQATASDGAGIKVGAIMGGIFGVIGGPVGIALGAVAGGFIGNIADAVSQSSPERDERNQWTRLIGDIDELVSKLLE